MLNKKTVLVLATAGVLAGGYGIFSSAVADTANTSVSTTAGASTTAGVSTTPAASSSLSVNSGVQATAGLQNSPLATMPSTADNDSDDQASQVSGGVTINGDEETAIDTDDEVAVDVDDDSATDSDDDAGLAISTGISATLSSDISATVGQGNDILSVSDSND